MPKTDTYKHMNESGDGATIGIESIARQIDALNYGSHRMLSAIARVRLARRQDDELGLGIKKLLDDGAF